MQTIKDPWGSGDPYERFMGRWSRPIAGQFVRWLDLPPGQAWLDLGCGTGALSRSILEFASPASILGTDPSPGFIDRGRRNLPDPRITFKVGTAEALPAQPASVDVLVSGLALNFFPDPDQAITEMIRVVRPGGTIAAYVWDYAGKMEMLRYFWDSAVALNPDAAGLDEGVRFPICNPEALRNKFNSRELREIVVEKIETQSVFSDFEDFWQPFLGGQGPAPGYVTSLSAASRKDLEFRLRDRLPARQDGTITLDLRAWAVRGRR